MADRSSVTPWSMLLLGHDIVPKGTNTTDLDLHHVPRPHVRGRTLCPQPDDVSRVERAVPADLGNMAGRVDAHVPSVEVDLDLAVNTDRGVQVIGVEISG